jgi:hypothetical protein
MDVGDDRPRAPDSVILKRTFTPIEDVHLVPKRNCKAHAGGADVAGSPNKE